MRHSLFPYLIVFTICLLINSSHTFAQCFPNTPFEHISPYRVGCNLEDIWGDGSNLYAVGRYGTIIIYDGASWTSMESGTNVKLHAIYGSGPEDIWVVGEDGTILRYNGIFWSTLDGGTDENLNGVWVCPDGNVFAVGNNGVLLTYNGIEWTIDIVNAPDLYHFEDVFGFSDQNVYAVGYGFDSINDTDKACLYMYNGASWQLMDIVLDTRFNSIWGTGPNSLYLLREETSSIYHFDGSSISLVQKLYTSYCGMWGLSDSDIFLVDQRYVITRGDGVSWNSIVVPYGLYPRGIWGDGADNIYVVDDYGSVGCFSNSTWQVLRGGHPLPMLQRVHGSGPNDVYAVGGHGKRGNYIMHFDGIEWDVWRGPSEFDFLQDPFGEFLHAVFVFSPNNLCFVSDSMGQICS